MTSNTSSAPVVFGCSTSQSRDLMKPGRAVDGILGFGQQGLSVSSQLSSQGITPNAFSHCLKAEDGGGGILVLGQIVEPNLVYTSLVPSQPHYNVNLQSIAVNGQTLNINPSVFSTSNNRGTIIDLGTLAYCAEEAYDPFVDAITQSVSQSVRPLLSKGNQCYLTTSSLNFAGGASMILRPQDYLLQQNSVCGALAFRKIQSPGITILGAYGTMGGQTRTAIRPIGSSVVSRDGSVEPGAMCRLTYKIPGPYPQEYMIVASVVRGSFAPPLVHWVPTARSPLTTEVQADVNRLPNYTCVYANILADARSNNEELLPYGIYEKRCIEHHSADYIQLFGSNPHNPERRYAKYTGEATARTVREKVEARARWKSAKEAARKRSIYDDLAFQTKPEATFIVFILCSASSTQIYRAKSNKIRSPVLAPKKEAPKEEPVDNNLDKQQVVVVGKIYIKLCYGRKCKNND
ncbi:ABC transporter g family member 28 [Phtheirospermum japonicum]|uniref:ABC transporter g family member 28 n=1 Tax=Phtheirospermum japonicum TaxID=374723 RepID=A0A830BNN7_9LAMI|nr:ABC transporter g family member 28 [Phtheirospermum japonicum]